MTAQRVAVGLGANLGSREAALRFAVDVLREDERVEIESVSPIYSTKPVGPPQPDFLNAGLIVRTELPPEELLGVLHRIETLASRNREGPRWGPRTLDLDLLCWDGDPIEAANLKLPHPQLKERSFALAPLLDVWPDLDARYREALDAAGGQPPIVGHLASSPSVTVQDGLIHATAQSLADATVFALDEAFSCFSSEPSAHFDLEPLVPMRFVARAVARVAEGFIPWRTLISSFGPKEVEGRLVGRPGDALAMRLDWVRFGLDPVFVELRLTSG